MPQNISIKCGLSRFDQKKFIFVVFYACPIFRTTYAMALQYEFELSTLPSIPFNGHVGGLC